MFIIIIIIIIIIINVIIIIIIIIIIIHESCCYIILGFLLNGQTDDAHVTPIYTPHPSHYIVTSVFRHSNDLHSLVAISLTPRTPQPIEDEIATIHDVLSEQIVGGIPLDGRVQDLVAIHRRTGAHQYLPMYTPSGARNPKP
jgi:hypothetical protein